MWPLILYGSNWTLTGLGNYQNSIVQFKSSLYNEK
jgi:hypothetical protein